MFVGLIIAIALAGLGVGAAGGLAVARRDAMDEVAFLRKHVGFAPTSQEPANTQRGPWPTQNQPVRGA